MADPLRAEQIAVLRRQLLNKGAEINEKLTELLAAQKPEVDIERLLGKGVKVARGGTPIERLRRFMALIDGGLRRIRDGVYGRCEQCGANLPFDHLREVPWIDTCQSCAQISPAETDPKTQ